MAKLPEKQIQESLDSIKASRKEASTAKAAIVKLSRSSQKITDNLAKLFTNAKTDINAVKSETEQIKKDAKKEYNSFKTTYTAATNKTNGMEVRYSKLVSLHNSARVLENEISKNATKAKNTTTTIVELKDSAKKNEKEIAEVHDRANIVKQEIEDTYSIVIDTTLAGTLVKRKEDLNSRVNLWEWVYIGSLAAIVITILLALTVSRPNSFSQVITERLVFVTPLVLIAFVASRQFAHERKLLEEYAFKAASAQSLRGYTLLLNEQFKDVPGAQGRILEFTVNAMTNIYDRKPLEARLGNYHFMFGNKMARFEAKIDEKLGELKDEIEKGKEIIQEAASE